jgi:hypothetical protein
MYSFINWNNTNNSYVNNNIKKYSNVKANIKFYKYRSTLTINDMASSQVICIYNNIKPSLVAIKVPYFSLILFHDDTFSLITTPISLHKIKFLPKQFDLQNLINNISWYENALITNNPSQIPVPTKQLYDNGTYEIIKFNMDAYNCTKHGWFSKENKEVLKYVINMFKPKTIIELGSWYGLSSSFIAKYASNANIHFFDKFQNILETKYKFKINNPVDKFYFEYPRYECFYKNLNSVKRNGKIFMYKKNAMTFFDYIKTVDLIYIDFLKKQHELYKFLLKIYKHYPNVICVGDDYVFQSVKNAIIKFKSKTKSKLHIITFNDCYIISPQQLINIDKTIRQIKKQKQDHMMLEQGNIKTLDDKYAYSAILFRKLKFNNALQFIKQNNLDMNLINKSLNNNSLYHMLALRTKNNDIIKLFEDYQKPNQNKNIFLLSFTDILHLNDAGLFT